MGVYAAFIPIVKGGTQSVEKITPINSDFIFQEISPNPASDEINIKFQLNKDSKIKFSILDLNGNLVKDIPETYMQSGLFDTPVNISALASGSYFIKVSTDFGYAVNQFKVIK